MKIDNVQDGIVMNQHSGTFRNDGAGRSIAGRKGNSISGKHIYYPEVITVPFLKDGVIVINLPIGGPPIAVVLKFLHS